MSEENATPEPESKPKNQEHKEQHFKTYGGRFGCCLFWVFLFTIPLSKCSTSLSSQMFGPSEQETATVMDIDTSVTRNYDAPSSQSTDVMIQTADGKEHRLPSSTAIHVVEAGEEVLVERSLWNGKLQAIIKDGKVHSLHLFDKLVTYLILGFFLILIGCFAYAAVSTPSEGMQPSRLRNIGSGIVAAFVILLAIVAGFMWETRGLSRLRKANDKTSFGQTTRSEVAIPPCITFLRNDS